MGNSPLRIKRVIIFLLLHFSLLFPLITLGQKPLLQQPVSILVSDKPISDVLDKLSNICGVRFTYDPDDISAGKRISIEVKNMPLSDVLTKVFVGNSLAFREKGGQVIIFRDRSVKEPQPQLLPVQQSKSDGESVLVQNKDVTDKEKQTSPREAKVPPDAFKKKPPDTVYIVRHDTILKFKTLFRTDTITKRDTVFLKKEEPFPDVSHGERNRGFFADLSGSYLLSRMILSSSGTENEILTEKLETAGIQNLPGYSAGVGIGYRSRGWAVRSGLYYTRFFQSFSYTYEHKTGGYFETDTIEKYYTLSGPDTSWIYVTDSSWLERRVQQYNYKQLNQFRYIEFPISISYTVYHRNFDIYLSGGVIAGILPSSVGNFINPKPDFPVSPLRETSLNTFILSVTGGAGARFSLNDHAGLFTEVAYRQQLSSIYKDYPVTVKFGSISFRLGLTYNF